MGTDSIVYVYAADGSKLRATATLGGVTTTTDYCSNVIYENGVQKLLLTEAGYVTLDNGKYHYYLRDHQGNNRVVVDEKGAVEEVNHYYPFGGIFASTCSVQPYKYNGKELENTLLWYDYGARRYDAVLGRFTTVDPLAEKFYPWSPYAYCYSNPVKHIDPIGKFGETFWDVFNVILGLKSFKSNLEAGNYSEAFSDGIGIIMDAGSVLVPGVPGGAATAIKSVRNSDKYFDVLQAMRRGRINETKVLENIGEKKNTQIFQAKIQNNKTKKEEVVSVIPDAVNDTEFIEIKDTKSIYNTKQIRAELEAAHKNGKQFVIITGEKTYISGSVVADQIIRRKDIGPQ